MAQDKKEIVKDSSVPVKKTRTITIERKNKEGRVIARFDYAKVTARVGEFHKDNSNGSIRTECDFKDGWALFKATVIPEVKNADRYFTGTSLGKVGSEKALEKLETISVGRALAFAGYLSDGEIASLEEMAKYDETPQIDNTAAIEKLKSAKNIEALRLFWLQLSQAERDDAEVAHVKDLMKESYETIQVGTEDPGMAGAPQGEDNGHGTQKNLGL